MWDVYISFMTGEREHLDGRCVFTCHAPPHESQSRQLQQKWWWSALLIKNNPTHTPIFHADLWVLVPTWCLIWLPALCLSHAPFLSHLPFPRAWKMLWINVRYFLEGRRQNKTKQNTNILLSPLWITDIVHFVAVSIYKYKKGALVSIWFHIFCIQFGAPKLETALS